MEALHQWRNETKPSTSYFIFFTAIDSSVEKWKQIRKSPNCYFIFLMAVNLSMEKWNQPTNRTKTQTAKQLFYLFIYFSHRVLVANAVCSKDAIAKAPRTAILEQKWIISSPLHEGRGPWGDPKAERDPRLGQFTVRVLGRAINPSSWENCWLIAPNQARRALIDWCWLAASFLEFGSVHRVLI